MLALICNDGKGTFEDKLRLFLIYFMSTKSIPPSEMEQIEEALSKKAGADMGPLKLLKKYVSNYFFCEMALIFTAKGQKLSTRVYLLHSMHPRHQEAAQEVLVLELLPLLYWYYFCTKKNSMLIHSHQQRLGQDTGYETFDRFAGTFSSSVRALLPKSKVCAEQYILFFSNPHFRIYMFHELWVR